jgi:hypothetical protein
MSNLKETDSVDKDFDDDADAPDDATGPKVHTLDGKVLEENPPEDEDDEDEDEAEPEEEDNEEVPVFRTVADENIIIEPEQRPEPLVKLFK